MRGAAPDRTEPPNLPRGAPSALPNALSPQRDRLADGSGLVVYTARMGAVDEGAPPRELVIDATAAPGDSSDGAGSTMAPFALTAIVAGLLAKYVSPAAALLPMAAVIVLVVVSKRSSEGRFVLRVADGAVEVTRERRRGAAVCIALTDLVDVTLERKSHASGRGASATERVRLAFERRAPANTIFVPEDRVTPIEAQEWYAKVRVFLRKHGWVPENERAS